MKYRPDIDGLRAVAVLPVVLYHAGVSGLSGGYIGVDVFFVISGYLITTIVANEIVGKRFSILKFYERRARRILPALTVVILTTLVVGWFTMLPGELKLLGQSALAASVFLSNVYFYLKLGYFFQVAEFAPLLHTWSLAVEEQFYIFFPPLLALLFARGSAHRAIWAIGVLSLSSLAMAVFYLPQNPNAVFYLIFFRAWELGTGAMLALWQPAGPKKRWVRDVTGCLGLAAILLPVFLYASDTKFPGLAAIPPVLGAALLIFVGTNNAASITSSILTLRPIVWTGLLSYSLYLWHWPVISFLKVARADPHLPPTLTATALLLSFFLAWVSYKYVEQPFRKASAKRTSQSFILISSVVTIFAIVLMGGFLHLSGGVPSRLPAQATLSANAVNDLNPRRKECFGKVPGEALCDIGLASTGEEPYDFILLGDSHSLAVMPGIDVAAKKQQKRGLYAGYMGCLPIAGLQHSKERPRCMEFKKAIMSFLKERSDVSLVILTARWTSYVEGASYPGDANARHRKLMWVDPSRRSSAQTGNAQLFEAGLQEMVDAITETGRDVLVVGQAPEPGLHVPNVRAREQWLGWPVVVPLSRASHDAWAGRTESIFNRLAKSRPRVRFQSLGEVFCDEAKCRMFDTDGLPLYRDDDHVSRGGAINFLSGNFEAIWETN